MAAHFANWDHHFNTHHHGHLSLEAPLRWLYMGAKDMVATRFRGVFYGLVFALMGQAIAAIYATHWQFTMGLTAGFFLLGPFVCAGMYELSRQHERGEPISLSASMTCWSRNPASIGFFAAMLTFLMIVWARVSIVIFALFSNTDFPTLQGILNQIFNVDNLDFLGVWLSVGFIFASLAFAISLIAVPAMLDKNADTLMAVFASVRALLTHTHVAYFWAFLIVGLIGGSLALGFYPLLITAPLVGHATWHAYCELRQND